MRSDLTKLSLALATGVLMLGCQDQGPGLVGPDGLAPQFAVNCDDKPNHPKCGDPVPDPGGELRFTVVMDLEGVVEYDSDDLVQTGRVHNDDTGILMDQFKLDVSFLTALVGGVTCGTSGPLPGGLTGEQNDNAKFGQISDGGQTTNGNGSDGSFSFKFLHADITHNLWLRGTITDTDNWPPTLVSNTMTPRDDGYWSVTPHGKGNKQGCRGEGNGADWVATIAPA